MKPVWRGITKAELIGPRWIFNLSCGDEASRLKSAIDRNNLPTKLRCFECETRNRLAGIKI